MIYFHMISFSCMCVYCVLYIYTGGEQNIQCPMLVIVLWGRIMLKRKQNQHHERWIFNPEGVNGRNILRENNRNSI